MERRRFIRFEVPLLVEVKMGADLEFSSDKGLLKDFSREGLRLTLHELNFSPHTVVDLKIRLPQRVEPIPVSAKVAWSKFNSDNWEVGMKIEKIDKQDKSEILDYVYEKWLKEQTSHPEDASA